MLVLCAVVVDGMKGPARLRDHGQSVGMSGLVVVYGMGGWVCGWWFWFFQHHNDNIRAHYFSLNRR